MAYKYSQNASWLKRDEEEKKKNDAKVAASSSSSKSSGNSSSKSSAWSLEAQRKYNQELREKQASSASAATATSATTGTSVTSGDYRSLDEGAAAWSKYVQDQLYKRKGGQALKNSGLQNVYESVPSAIREMQAAYKDDDTAAEYARLNQIDAQADSENKQIRARTGDTSILDERQAAIDALKESGQDNRWYNKLFGTNRYSNQDEIDAAEDEYQEYVRLLRLSGYENSAKALSYTNADNTIAKQTLKHQTNYSEEDLRRDLDILEAEEYSYIPQVGHSRDYTEAKQRLESYFGYDITRELEIVGSKWRQPYLDQYAADTAKLDDYVNQTSGVGGTDAAISGEDYLDYQRKMDQAEADAAAEEARRQEYAQRRQMLHAGYSLEKDYAANSQYVQGGEYYTAPEYGVNAAGDIYRLTAESYDSGSMLNDLVKASEDPEKFDALVETLNNLPNGYGALALAYAGRIKYMTDEDRRDYFYVYNTQGVKAAENLLRDTSYNYDLLRQETEELQAELQAMIEENWANAIGLSLVSVFENTMAGVAGISEVARYIMGDEISEYDPVHQMGLMRDTTRSTVGGEIAEATEDIGILNIAGLNIPQMAYSGVMSGVDSAANAAIYGHAAPIMMGFSAFDSAYRDNVAEKGDTKDAFVDAVVAGAIEALTEYVSIENLLDDSIASAGKVIAKTVFAEESEEIVGMIANKVYDAAKYGENSEYNRRISELQTMGYTKAEAVQIANSELGKEALETVITTLFSVTADSGVKAGQIANANVQTGKAIQQNAEAADYQTLIDIADTVQLSRQGERLLDRLKAWVQQQYTGGTSEATAQTDAQEAAQQAYSEAQKNGSANISIDSETAERGVEAAQQENIAQQAQELAEEVIQSNANEAQQSETPVSVDTQAAAEASRTAVQDTQQDDIAQQAQELATEVVQSTENEAQQSETPVSVDTQEVAEAARTAVQDTQQDDIAQQAQELAADMSEAPEANAEEVAEEIAKDGKKTGKRVKISNAQIGLLYRETMQLLDEQAQNALRERMSFNVAKELRGQGVARQDARTLAESILRVQDGSFTEADVETVSQSREAREVLAKWTEKVATENDAAEKIDRLSKITQEKERTAQTNVADAESETEAEAADEFDAVAAEVAKKSENAVRSENESSTLDGEDVKIMGVVPVTDAENARAMLKVQTVSGEERTVSADDIIYGTQDANVYKLAAYAAEYGKQADIMYNAYLPSQDADAYARAFDTAYRYGSDGRNSQVLKSSGAVSVLNEQQIGIAYELGRDQRAQRLQEVQAVRSTKGTEVQVGNVDVSAIEGITLSEHQQASVDVLGDIAEALGINVRVVETQADAQGHYTDANGAWNADTRTLTVDINAGSNYTADVTYAMTDTVGHELTHYIWQFADNSLKNEYQDFVIGHLDTKLDINQEIDALMAKDRNLSRDDAIEEIIADASVKALANISEQNIRALAESNPTLFSRIRSFVNEWVSKVREKLHKAFHSGKSETNRFAQAMSDAVDEMAAKWNRLLVSAAENANGSRQQSMNTEATQSADAAQETQQNESAKTVQKVRSEAKQDETKGLFLPFTHIDQRTLYSVKNDDVQLFSSEVEIARMYYSYAADLLLDDLRMTQPGQRFFIDKSGQKYNDDPNVIGVKRETSPMLAEIKDSYGLSWERIGKLLEAFRNVRNSEDFAPVKNTLNNRRLEVYLHQILTQGYTLMDGTKIAPSEVYAENIAMWQGSRGDGLNAEIAEDAIPFETYFDEELLDAWYEERENRKQAKQSEQQTNEAEQEDDVRYSARDGIEFAEDKYYSRLLDRIEDAKEGAYLRVGAVQSGSILNQVGLPSADLYFDVSKIRKTLEKHGDHLDKNTLKQIPDILRNPVVITEEIKGGDVNVFGNVFVGNSPLLIGIVVTNDHSGINIINKVRTVHARRDSGAKITDQTVLYLDRNKERTQSWFQALGTHMLPLGGTKLGFIRSIAQNAEDVKFQKRNAEDDAAYVKEAKAHFGKTYSYNKAGYIVTDGSMLDFSGKHEGYDSGSRSVDHREIWEVRQPDGMSGTEAMIDFMAAGNIRLSPEMGGINLIAAPTKAQESTLMDYISKFRGEVTVDIDNERGETVHSFEYNRGTHYSRVLNDLRAYFRDGTVPEAQSNLNQFLYQKRDPYNASDRELLANALESAVTTEEDLHRLRLYQKKIGELNETQQKLQQTREKIRELRKADAKTNKDEITRLKNQAEIYEKQINRADSKLLDFESLAPLKELAKRQRAAYRQELRQKESDKTKEYRKEIALQRAYIRELENSPEASIAAKDAAENAKQEVRDAQRKEQLHREIYADTKRMYDWVGSPTNWAHVPEMLRKPLGEFLQSIDTRSKQNMKSGTDTRQDVRMTEALESMRRTLANLHNQDGIDNGEASSDGYIDLPDGFLQQFDELIGDIKKELARSQEVTQTPLMKMNLAQLEYLNMMMKMVKSGIQKMNDTYANAQYKNASSMANDTISDLTAMRARKRTNKAWGTIVNMYNWKNATPYYAFQRLGRGGKAVFEGLQDGLDRYAQNVTELIDYAEDAFTAKQSKAWSNDIKTIELSSGEKVQMTAAQLMSLYCLSKRTQAQGHLLGGGIRISDINMRAGNVLTQVQNYTLTQGDIEKMIGMLTSEQRSVADKLQTFMNTTLTKWGNEISMKRFNYRMFTEQHYFPIETDSNNRSRIDDKKNNSSMFRLLNLGALKPLTPKANNAIIISDIFDVFSNHATDIAKYNAMSLPILDYIKWYNFVEKSGMVDADGQALDSFTTRSTQKALEHAYGKNATEYLTNFIKDLNSEHDGGRNDGFLSRLMSNAKAGAVGLNPRVYFLQITSMPRAAYAISPKYLLKGMMKIRSLNPLNAIKGTQAQKEIGILKWKNLGFYNMDVARNTRDMVRRDTSVISTLRDVAMKPAEWGDNWTSNIIYEAVKAEMKAKQPQLTEGSKAYNMRLNQRVREIVYKTQVVDSTMTRSDFMRSKGLMTAFTAFMSEPTLTANMLNESIQEAVANRRKGMKAGENLRSVGGKVVRAAATFAFTATFTALMEALFDALRDDDDYETFMDKVMDALGENITDNLNIFAMLPIIKDVISIAQGYDNNSLVMQAAENFIDVKNAIVAWKKGTRPIYSVIYNALKVVGSTTGVGVQNATRDGIGLYNTFLADAWDMPKVQTYSDSKTNAADAYYDALRKDDADKAEWILHRAEVNGYDEEDFESRIKSLIAEDHAAGELSDDEAQRMYEAYAGKTEYGAATTILKAGYELATGREYNDVEDAYISGEINASEARKALMEYGEMFAYQADEQVLKWKCEIETGHKYSELQTEYLRGEISRSEIVKWYDKYGSMTNNEAESTVLKLDYQKKTGRPYSKLMYDYAEGRYTESQVKEYLMKYGGKSETQALEEIDKYKWAIKNNGSSEGYSKYIAVHEAIESGNGVEEAVSEIVERDTGRGKEEKEVLSGIRSSITSKYKPIYLAAPETERERLLPILLDAYVAAGGKRSTYERQITKNWLEVD